MAKDCSAHQQRIIRNYYRNLDSIRAQRLQELVTELWLAETDKKRDRLWARTKDLLEKGDAPPPTPAAVDRYALKRTDGQPYLLPPTDDVTVPPRPDDPEALAAKIATERAREAERQAHGGPATDPDENRRESGSPQMNS